MQHLPSGLAALGAYRQFCLYATAPDPAKPGKLKKWPCNYEGKTRDAHDDSILMTADEAIAWANYHGAGYGVAFVFKKQDPFWFLDIDSCRDPLTGEHNPLAESLISAFRGCAVEVSSSGTGYHIIGSGFVPSHRTRDVHKLHLEFYTELRFIALTGDMVSGDVATVCPPELMAWLVNSYFPASTDSDVMPDWTDEPCPEWRGPVDDDELLRRAMHSVSHRGAFQGKATFADLWSGNAEVLSRNYPPDPGGNHPWGQSDADSALAAHLAFWTGRNCERIEQLMQRSALKRDKWDRGTYMQPTIINACRATRNVCQDKPLEKPILGPRVDAADIERAAVATARAESEEKTNIRRPQSHIKTGSTWVTPEQQIELFDGCVFIRSEGKIWIPTGEKLNREAFKVVYGGYTFVIDRENSAKTTDAWEAFTQSRAVRHDHVAQSCFRPDVQSGAILSEGGVERVNTYIPVNVRRIAGDAGPFWEHMRRLLPVERDRIILMSYLAGCAQYKGTKFKWAPLLQGVEGNGKTFFSMCVAYAVGSRYVHWPKASKLGAQFNAWMYGRLLYCVEDIYTPRNKLEVIEELKPMITGENLEIEGKGIDQDTKDVCGNFIFNTNHKAALRKTRNDRRFAHFYTAQQDEADLGRDGLTGTYMTNLYDWLRGTGSYAHLGAGYGFAIVAELLHTWKIPDEFNPATNCQRAPVTSSTSEAIDEGLGVIEQNILEAIDEGREGFRNGWISSTYLTRLLEEKRLTVTPKQRPSHLRTLGYIPHPNLPGGRLQTPVLPDAAKPVVYVKIDHPDAEHEVPSIIAKKYTESQVDK